MHVVMETFRILRCHFLSDLDTQFNMCFYMTNKAEYSIMKILIAFKVFSYWANFILVTDIPTALR